MNNAGNFRAPPARHLVGIAGSAAVLFVGLFLPDPFARWLCVFLGAIGLLTGAAKVALSPRTMVFDDDGFTVETPFRSTRVRWRDIRSLHLHRLQQNKVIIVKCSGRWQGGRPFRLSKARHVERDYFIPNIFDAPLERILEQAELRLEQVRADQATDPPPSP
ncbi:MAG: hypothetical protein LPJ87_08615 [Zoogloeaceae bacterium]|nr:hypothetical protein [Zoogloeaceae bacterium]